MPYTTPTTPEEIRDFVSNFQKTRIFLTAFELNLFSVLSDYKKASAEVAKEIKASEHGTDRLMNSLVALGFLTKENNLFGNTALSRDYFCDDKPAFISGLMHSVNQWDTWSTLTEAVKAGTTVAKRKRGINEREKGWLFSFIDAMHNRAQKQAPDIVRHIDMKGVSKVLDIGGGSGAYAMAFANSGENISATVFDLPNVVELSKKYVADAGLWNKIDFVKGDYHLNDFPLGYDIVFLSAIVHINSFEENMRLIEKCAASLNKCGRIIIQDHIMDNDRTRPIAGAIFALNMLVGTEKGDTYTESEIGEWFKKAGLKDFLRVEASFGNSLIMASK